GVLLHGAMAIGAALIYTALMIAFGMTGWPSSLLVGLGLGTFHGIVVSLALVWMVADAHPLPEFREAGPAVFLEHIFGHIAYGAVVGIVVALSPLTFSV